MVLCESLLNGWCCRYLLSSAVENKEIIGKEAEAIIPDKLP